MNAFIKLLYSLLIAIAVVTFVAVGVFSFYQMPASPGYTNYPSTNFQPGQKGYEAQQAAYTKANDDSNKAYDAFRDKEKAYYRNVGYIVLPATALLLGVGVVALKRKHTVAEGIALGGIATAVYAIIIASMANNRIERFIAVTLLLAGAILIAHRRFAGEK